MAEGIPVYQVLSEGTRRLEAAGVDEARVNVELLLSHVLQTTRLRLLLESQRPLSSAEATALEHLLQQRALRRPLQHLIGTAPFLEHAIEVTPDVLIPRPETEVLVQHALERARERRVPTLRILDFATGSGCIAIALAHALPTARIDALDISGAALDVARRNAVRHGCAERIQFHIGDGFEALSNSGLKPGTQGLFDFVVTNPPYIPSGDIAGLDAEVRDHDPRLALDGGDDGLDFYRRLARESVLWLKEGGVLLAEYGDGQGPVVARLFEATGAWWKTRLEKDLSDRERIIIVERANRPVANAGR